MPMHDIYIYIYKIHIHIHACVYVYVYIYICIHNIYTYIYNLLKCRGVLRRGLRAPGLPAPLAECEQRGLVKIRQRGVQWKQDVVICMVLYPS